MWHAAGDELLLKAFQQGLVDGIANENSENGRLLLVRGKTDPAYQEYVNGLYRGNKLYLNELKRWARNHGYRTDAILKLTAKAETSVFPPEIAQTRMSNIADDD